MSAPSANFPVLLLPLKIETRFITVRSAGDDDQELWIRVFPDQPFLKSFNPVLTIEEKRDRSNFDGTEDAWSYLVGKYGQYRAAWIIQIPEDELQAQPNEAPAINPAAFFYSWLPDYFKAFLYWRNNDGDLIIEEAQFSEIDTTQDIPLLEPDTQQTDGESDLGWIENFAAAEALGMAKRVILQSSVTQFERIIVVGIRSEEAEPSAALVRTLLHNHQYSQGFSFLDYGTPTNNLKGLTSGFSSHDVFDAERSYSYAVNGLSTFSIPALETDDPLFQQLLSEYPTQHLSYAESFSTALGFDIQDFRHVNNAGGHISRLGKLLRKATWFSLGGQMLKMLFGHNISNDLHREIWSFYSEFVEPNGPYPTIKINNLPYGVLPVTNLRGILNNRPNELDTIQDKIDLAITQFFEQWLSMATADRPPPSEGESADGDPGIYAKYVPRMVDVADADRESELLRILSMEPKSTELQWRLLELERVPAWFSNLVTTPQMISTFPPLLIDELLRERSPHYDRNLDFAQSHFLELDEMFAPFFHTPNANKDILKYAPILSFKNITEIQHANLNTASNDSLPLTFSSDWYQSVYLKFIKDYLDENKPSLLSEGSNAENNAGLRWYNGELSIAWLEGELSVLLDLLLRSYAQAVQLYYRDIYFFPSRSEVEGIFSYSFEPPIDETTGETGIFPTDGTVIAQKGQEVMRVRIGNSERTISLIAPFAGVIEKVFVQENTAYNKQYNSYWDRKLYRLKDGDGFDQMSREMAATGAQLALELERLAKDEKIDLVQAQENALKEVLDLNSFRLDAWLTGIAAKKIQKLRGVHPQGFYYGAYGWIENLSKDEVTEVIYSANQNEAEFEDRYRSFGGIIHCPSPGQAVTAGMFRQSFSTYQPESDASGTILSGSPYTLNLTSDRIQKAKRFLEDINQGQDIEALLGYRLERYLRDYPMGPADENHNLISNLQQKFGLAVDKIRAANDGGIPQMTVIDGLSVLQNRKLNDSDIQHPATQEGIQLIANILDGSADLLLYEAGFQMSQGNFNQAAAVMDAAKGKVEPPKVEAMDTRLPGSALEHKLLMIFNPPTQGFDKPSINPKAFIEPTLEQWLSTALGPFEHIACQVNIFNRDGSPSASLSVTLDQLQIGALDLLAMSFNKIDDTANELEQRILKVAIEPLGLALNDIQYKISAAVGNNKLSLQEAMQLMQSVRALLRESRFLKVEDIAATSELNRIKEDASLPKIIFDTDFIPSFIRRIEACINQLKSENTPLTVLAKYDVQNAQGRLLQPDDLAEERSRQEAQKLARKVEDTLNAFNPDDENVSYHAKLNQLQEMAQLLFGKSFVIVPPFILTEAFRDTSTFPQDELVGKEGQPLGSGITGGQERIRHWIEGRALVDTQTEAFSDYLLIQEVWTSAISQLRPNSDQGPWHFNVIQYTTLDNCPWIALDRSEIMAVNPDLGFEEYPDGALAMVILKQENNNFQSDRQYGLLIDHFPEFIPQKTLETGLAFEYNAPNNEAPQAWLLAVSSDDLNWNVERLRDIIYDTIDLAKVRMVDSDALQGFSNIFPMSYWFNVPNSL